MSTIQMHPMADWRTLWSSTRTARRPACSMAAANSKKWKTLPPQRQSHKGCTLGRLYPSGMQVRCCAEASGSGDETIAAIVTATAQDSGSVAIVRLSGRDALRIGMTLMGTRGHLLNTSHKVNVTQLEFDGETLDEAIIFSMRAPRSYTREDVVEIHTHGGAVCSQRVLDATLRLGARLARPGEFTMRAFLNGRLSLAEAEAIQQLLKAPSSRAADAALSGLKGHLTAEVTAARQKVIAVLADIEAHVDFEDDLGPLDREAALAAVRQVHQFVQIALETASRARVLYNEAPAVVLAGRPNTGKSSLLNAWARDERAIVTSTPGTTRDIVEAAVSANGLTVRLQDTAGIRDLDLHGDDSNGSSSSNDAIESIGIARAGKAIRSADIVVFLVSVEDSWGEEDERAYATVEKSLRPECPLVLAINKYDLAPEREECSGRDAAKMAGVPSRVLQQCSRVMTLSAKTELGLEEMQKATEELLLEQASGSGSLGEAKSRLWVINRRQETALARASSHLAEVIGAVELQDVPEDLWCGDLRAAAAALAEVTGEQVTEDVLDNVFSTFCIGK